VSELESGKGKKKIPGTGKEKGNFAPPPLALRGPKIFLGGNPPGPP